MLDGKSSQHVSSSSTSNTYAMSGQDIFISTWSLQRSRTLWGKDGLVLYEYGCVKTIHKTS